MKRIASAALIGLLAAAAASAATDQQDVKPIAKPSLLKAAALWSYQPIKAADVPTVKDRKWTRTPIDAFVLAKLEEKSLKPSPEANRAAFIRRATLDTWGLIPTPEQVQAFVSDRSPNAYEKLVDGLLASSHYGERQARRWLDLARYADSNGFDNDETRPNAWRYRDYVVNSFNQNKPYDRFIREQLAGDELWPDQQDARVATGFLRAYPENPNARDLVAKRYQITTDITDTVGAVFLAQTVECARCHDHKLDKISQKEYFQLQAFFANIAAEDDVAAATGEQEKAYRAAWAKYEEAYKPIREAKKALIDTVRPQALAYLKERYNEVTLASLNKPQDQWTAQDRLIHQSYGVYIDDDRLSNYLQDTSANPNAPDYNAENGPRWEAYRKLRDAQRKLNALRPNGSDQLSTISELGHADAPPTHLLFGGILERPIEEVQPGFPASITKAKPQIVPTATSSGRRTALANWIASAENPLTARVLVNRVWSQYFDHGLVDTTSDFGRAGGKPTHPELLDYLATDFVKNGWDIKHLHRQILLSSVYRQSSDARDEIHAKDPDNKLLAVFPRKRLEAEEIRDSLLVASGKLEDKLGGPAVFPPVPADFVTGNSNTDGSPLWNASKDPRDQNRRSLYVFTRRSVPYPLLETFDMASPQQVHSQRVTTTTPLQALTLLNSEVVFGWSQALAGRVIRESDSSSAAQLDRLFQILYARKPYKEEKQALQAYLKSQETAIRQKATSGSLAINVPTGLEDVQQLDPVRAAAFVDLVQTVVNSNEFAYRF